MILGLVEDYQKIITNPQTCSNVVVALSELIKHILYTKMQMINDELSDRRRAGEVSCYIAALRDHVSKLEIQNTKLWDSINGSNGGESTDFETVFETEPGSPIGFLAEIHSENIKKIHEYHVNNALLESARSELERVSLGHQPDPSYYMSTPSGVDRSGFAASTGMPDGVEDLKIQMDSVVNKMTENIAYSHSLITELEIKYTLLRDQTKELEMRIEYDASRMLRDSERPSVVREQSSLRSGCEASTQTVRSPTDATPNVVHRISEPVDGQRSPVGVATSPDAVPFLKRGPPPGFSDPPQGVRSSYPGPPQRSSYQNGPPQRSSYPGPQRSYPEPPHRNKEKYNKNKERNDLREQSKKKQYKESNDKKE